MPVGAGGDALGREPGWGALGSFWGAGREGGWVCPTISTRPAGPPIVSSTSAALMPAARCAARPWGDLVSVSCVLFVNRVGIVLRYARPEDASTTLFILYTAQLGKRKRASHDFFCESPMTRLGAPASLRLTKSDTRTLTCNQELDPARHLR